MQASIRLRPPSLSPLFLLLLLLPLLFSIQFCQATTTTSTATTTTLPRLDSFPHYHHRRHLQTTPSISPTDAYDIGGPAPICWRTVGGVSTRLPSFPPEITLEFIHPPPITLFSMTNYPAIFRATIDAPALGLVSSYSAKSGETWDIPHANTHSCVATVGFCTPMIENTPGLATHAPSLSVNFTQIPGSPLSEAIIPSRVRLDPGCYTIIAHIMFTTKKGPVTSRYSVAAAIVRDVLPPKIMLTISPVLVQAMGAVVAATAGFLLLNLVCLLWYRKHKVMRFSQVNILVGMTMAGLMAVATLPLAAVFSDVSCLLRPWVTIVPLNLMFGLLFGKTWRIYRLMNNKQLKAIKIKETAVLMFAFCLTLPEVVIHGVYFLMALPTVAEKNVMNEFTFVHVCASDLRVKGIFDALHLTYAGCILILGCYVAHKSASLTTLFNEGKYILFAIYTCSVLAVIIVPASFAVAANPPTAYILRTMGVCLAVAGTIASINLPKIMLIRSGVEMSLVEDGKATTAGGGIGTKGSNRTASGGARASMSSPVLTKTGKEGAGSSSSGASSSSASPPPAAAAAAGGGPSAAGSGSDVIHVKNHIPSSIFGPMQAAHAAATKVLDHQRQGYALNGPEFDACVQQMRLLNDLLQRCELAAVPAGGGGGVGAKVAPAPSSSSAASGKGK